MDRLDNQLHQLHHEGLLILTNVADAAGARLVEQLGNKAVATSSAAVAWVHATRTATPCPLSAWSRPSSRLPGSFRCR